MHLGLGGSRRFAAAALLGALTVFGAPDVRAQDASGKAAAEALFDSGVQLMKAGRFSEACPKLETSQRVDPAVGTLLYLAECYERLGRTASAWATFREAESLARGANQADRARTAGSRAQKLEAELAYLTVSVAPEARVEGLVVKRGGSVVLPDLYGVAAPVDPGVIEIEASAPGHRPHGAQVKVGARGKEIVTVPKLEADPRAEVPPVAPVAAGASTQATTEPTAPSGGQPPKDAPPKSGPDHTLAFVLGGVGLVGIGVGSYFGMRAFSKNSEADDFCNDQNVCQKEGMDLSQEAENAALVSNIGFIAGGAALATGLVLFFTAGDGEEKQTLRVAPTVAKSGGGVSIGGTFR
jgi:serine/threonine-protein kinase